MSITVDTINLRFNVTPDYNQQQLQKLQEDLKQSQKDSEHARKELDKYTQKVVNLQGELSQLKAKRAELAKQKTLTTEESKEFDRLSKAIEKTEDDLMNAKEQQNKWSGELTGSIREMRSLEQQMKKNTNGTNLYAMSLNQLRERQKDLNAVLNNLSPNNESYQELKDELDNINQRMKELRQASLDMHEGEDIAEMSANQLTERLLALNTAFRDCKPEDNDFKRYAKAIKDTQKQLDLLNEATKESKEPVLNFHNEVKLADLTIDELQERLQALNTVFRNLKPDDDKFHQYAEKIKETKDRISSLNEEISQTKESLEKTEGGWRVFLKRLNEVGFAINNALAIKDRIVQWADQYVQSFAQMDEAMTDVMKYTGQTKREVEEMNETFKQMTTRTPREELNALAGAAGRLGITAKKDIEGFVDAADKINVALGDDLGEGAIDQIGKLTMVFGEDKTKGLNGAMLATGSAINVLGANSSANTGFITEFTSSMAGMAVNAKISQTDIMGYASALSQAGIEGQTASGVFAQLITKMFTEPARFAKAARLDVKSFTDLLKTDANQAILQFLEGLKQNGGFDALAPALKSLKMQGTQAVPVISSLINKMDELKKAQQDARQAYDEGTSIIEEFNNANSSAAAKLDIAKKALNDVSVELGKKLMPIVEGGISTATTGIKIISTLISFGSKYAITITSLTAVIGALIAMENADIIKKQLQVFWNEKVIVSSKNLWTALKANPYALIIGAVVTLAAAMYELMKNTDRASASQKALNKIRQDAAEKVGEEESAIQTLIRASKNELLSKEDRLAAIDKLQKQIPGYVTELNRETGAYKENKAALDEYLESLSKKYEIEGAKDRLKEIGKELANLRTEQKKAQTAADNAHNSGAGYTYTSSWGSTGNTSADAISHAEDRLDRANKAIERKLKERQDIYDAFGVDLQKSEAKAIDPVATADTGNTSGSSSSTKSGSELKKEQTERERQRKELEAQAKAAYEREKIELRQQYQGRKQMQDEWHQKEFDAEQQYIDRLAKIRVDYGASEADRMEVANMQLDSIAREANRQEEVRKREQQQKLKEIDQQQFAEEIALSRQQLTGEISTREEYDRKKLECEVKYQQQRIALMEKGSDEYRAAQNRMAQLEVQQLQQQKTDTDNFTKSYQDINNRLLHQNFEGESFERMRELNEEYRQKDLISYQQYQQNLTDIAQAEADKRQAIQQAATDSVNNLLSSASQLFSAMQQRETSAVDAKYKKLIAAAKKQGKDTTKLEEQQEAEKQAIAKKYADRNFKIQVLQIISNTAQGVSKTIAELGMPWAIPFVAMATAAGAMQLASAKAAADQAAGLYEGGYSDEYQEGYTKKGDPRKQAGVIPVHQSEFVANHKAVANPEVRPVLDVIDRHQKQGDIQMLNSTRMLEEAYGSGRYRGGYAGRGSGLTDPDHDKDQEPIPATSEVESLLRRIEQNTGRSLTVRTLRDEIAHEERLERNARR